MSVKENGYEVEKYNDRKSGQVELFAKMPLALWKNGFISRISGSAMKVLVLLMLRADFEKKTCWPSITTIARDTGLCRQSVVNATDQLCRLGLVEIVGEKGKANLYGIRVSEKILDGLKNRLEESNNLTHTSLNNRHKQDTIELKPTTQTQSVPDLAPLGDCVSTDMTQPASHSARPSLECVAVENISDQKKLLTAQDRLTRTNFFDRSKVAVGMADVFGKNTNKVYQQTSRQKRKSRTIQKRIKESNRPGSSFKSHSRGITSHKPHYAKLPTEGKVDMAAYAEMGVEEIEVLPAKPDDGAVDGIKEKPSTRPGQSPSEPDKAIDAIIRSFFNCGDNAGRRKSLNNQDTVRKWASQRLIDYPAGSIIQAIADSGWAVRPEGVDKKLLTMKTRNILAAHWQQQEDRRLAKAEQDKQRAAENERMKAIPPKTTVEKIEMYRRQIEWCRGKSDRMIPFFQQRINELEEQLKNEKK